eukprot:427583-Pleurochrysis_carterae.AAC.1
MKKKRAAPPPPLPPRTRLLECSHLTRRGVDVERVLEVWIAVRREGEAARRRIKGAAAAVGTAHHAHVVPQVAAVQVARHDRVGSHVSAGARLKEAAAGSHIVDLKHTNARAKRL